MTRRDLLILGCTVFLAEGCATTGAFAPATPTVTGTINPTYPPGSPADYAAFLRPGKGILDGQAFLTTRGGEVRLAAGRVVTLDPVTTLSRAWFRTVGSVAGRFEEAPADTLFLRARRTATVDAQGKFRFADLAPGMYYVRTIVSWEVANEIQGGLVADSVGVNDSRESSAILHEVVDHLSSANTTAVPVVTVEQLNGTAYKSVGSVHSGGCQSTEKDALASMARAAKELGANALIDAQCRLNTNALDSTCTVWYECIGNAVQWK